MDETVFDLSAESSGDVCALRCRGEIDVATVGELSRRLEECIDARPAKLHLDLSRTTFFGSVGAEALLEAKRACKAVGVSLEVTASPSVVRVLDLMGLAWLVTGDAPPGTRAGLGAERAEP